MITLRLKMTRPRTILVVEDDPELRQLYWQALTFEGYHVITAEDGATALDCVRVAPPALVILDLRVPRLSGWEFHRHLTDSPSTRHVPVIVVSGADASEVVSEVAAFFQKPMPVQQLVEEVQRQLL